MTARLFLLTLLGLVPILLVPTWTMGLIVIGVLIIVGVLDFFLVPRIHDLRLQRTPGPLVRLGAGTHRTLTLINDSPRRLRLDVRDAWAPSAGAVRTRSHHDLAPGEEAEVRTALQPVRRGALPADLVTVRSRSVLGLIARQKSIEVPAEVRVLPPFASRRELPSKTQKLRELEGRSAVMIRGLGTEFDSLRDYVDGGMMCAPSTGGPVPALRISSSRRGDRRRTEGSSSSSTPPASPPPLRYGYGLRCGPRSVSAAHRPGHRSRRPRRCHRRRCPGARHGLEPTRPRPGP